jgi:hypothetical protein
MKVPNDSENRELSLSSRKSVFIYHKVAASILVVKQID